LAETDEQTLMKDLKEINLADSPKLLESALKTLSGCRYFKTMSKETLKKVLQTGIHIEAPAKHYLIKEGDHDDDVYFLIKGSLKVLAQDKVVLRLNDPGDIVGEIAVVSSLPRSADVVTDADSTLIKVSASNVKEDAQKKGKKTSESHLAMEFLSVFTHIMAAKLTEVSSRARLYEDMVLEAQEMATSHKELESDIKNKLQEIRLYSQVIQTSTEAVLVCDSSGLVIIHNPTAEALLSSIGITLSDKHDTIHKIAANFDLNGFDLNKPGHIWRGEWMRGEGLNKLVLQVNVSPISVGGHEEIMIAYQMRDVTMQRQQEEAISMKNDEVQNTLRNLEATYQELQRSDMLKTETLSVISGELNSPIRKILNHAGKIVQAIEELTPQEISNHVRNIYDQTEYLRIVSENINYLSELQLEFQQGGMVMIDLVEVVENICTDLSTWASRNEIAFKMNFPENGLQMTGDADQISTVLNLLIEQAMLSATPKTRVTLSGSLLVESSQVELEISYTGVSLKSINPTEGDHRGRMGLMIGLPLARKVISQYQGLLIIGDRDGESSINIKFPKTQKQGEERPNRIMIVDESDMDRMISKGVIDHLWPESVIYTTSDPFEFLDNYEDFRPDLVILDPSFTEPGWSNHRILASLTQHRKYVAPILSVSSLYKDFAERTIAVERGVTDFLAKPFSIFDLRFKVKSLLKSHRKEESLHQTMDQAQRQAYTDGLTKLANRKHFDEFLETQIDYSRQTGKTCSLIMLDVDNFKHYNDTNGHQMGDEVLRMVAAILAKSVRASDLAARYGGEEFVVVLPETGKEMASVIAEKVRRTIQETKFPMGEKQPLGFLSSSFGVSSLGEDADSGEGLIQEADNSLYQAKRQGRNKVVVAGRSGELAEKEDSEKAIKAG